MSKTHCNLGKHIQTDKIRATFFFLFLNAQTMAANVCRSHVHHYLVLESVSVFGCFLNLQHFNFYSCKVSSCLFFS